MRIVVVGKDQAGAQNCGIVAAYQTRRNQLAIGMARSDTTRCR